MAITQRQVFLALNTPGGPVYEYRDKLVTRIEARAIKQSPKNRVNNARHRGGITGTYRKSWKWTRFGNQNGAGFRIGNYSGHAVWVEEGRSMSTKRQAFSWTKWDGQIRYIGPRPKGLTAKKMAFWIRAFRDDPSNTPMPWGGRKTGARKGKHVLRLACNYVLVPEGLAPV